MKKLLLLTLLISANTVFASENNSCIAQLSSVRCLLSNLYVQRDDTSGFANCSLDIFIRNSQGVVSKKSIEKNAKEIESTLEVVANFVPSLVTFGGSITALRHHNAKKARDKALSELKAKTQDELRLKNLEAVLLCQDFQDFSAIVNTVDQVAAE